MFIENSQYAFNFVKRSRNIDTTLRNTDKDAYEQNHAVQTLFQNNLWHLIGQKILDKMSYKNVCCTKSFNSAYTLYDQKWHGVKSINRIVFTKRPCIVESRQTKAKESAVVNCGITDY